MAVLSQTDGQEKLSLWDVSDPLKVTRSKSQYFKLGLPSDFEFPMKMDKHFIIEEYKPYENFLQVDEHFIAANNLSGNREVTYYFISLKTFQVETSLSCNCEYLRR